MAMKFLTKAIEKRFAQVGEQDIPNPIIVAKFFNPGGAGTWYATSYDPDNRIFFGYVTGLAYDEWGYFSRDELEFTRIPPFGLTIERDLHWNEKKFFDQFPELVPTEVV